MRNFSAVARYLFHPSMFALVGSEFILGIILIYFGVLRISFSFGNLLYAALYILFGLYLLNHIKTSVRTKQYSDWHDFLASIQRFYKITKATLLLTAFLAITVLLLPVRQTYPVNFIYLLPLFVASELLYPLSIQLGGLGDMPSLSWLVALIPLYIQLLYLHYWARLIFGIYRRFKSGFIACQARASSPES